MTTQIMSRKVSKLASAQTVSPAEAAVRRDLAAAYRLVALFGWDALLATHISARVPGEETFLINPYGLMFEEITASSLVKVNLEGEIMQETPYSINRAGYVIHSAVHAGRTDVECVMHLHTIDGIAVSAIEGGLLPLNQQAMLVRTNIATHEYEGVALDEAERARLVADLGDKYLMLLRNHGTLAVGHSVAEAFYHMYLLENACSIQVRTLSQGLPLHKAPEDAVRKTQTLLTLGTAARNDYHKNVIWPALLRKLARENSGWTD